MQKFYVTKRSIIFSCLVLILSLALSVYLVAWRVGDPYEKAYNKVKTDLLQNLGIEVSAVRDPNTALFSSLKLNNVSLKFTGKDQPFFTADEVALECPFINLVLSFTPLPVPLSLRITNANIDIEESSLRDFDTSDVNLDLNTPESVSAKNKKKKQRSFYLLERKVALNLDNFNVKVQTSDATVLSNNLYANIAFDKDLNFTSFSLRLPELQFKSESGAEVGISGGSALLEDNDNVSFLFDKTYIKTNKNDITFNVDNFSPYIARNERGNQTLFLPLNNAKVNSSLFTSATPSVMVSVEFVSWSDINIGLDAEKLNLSGDFGNATLDSFNASFTTNKQTEVPLKVKGDLRFESNIGVVPLSSSFVAEGKSLAEPLDLNAVFDNIKFEGVDETFNLSLSLSGNQLITGLTSHLDENDERALSLNASYGINSKFLELEAFLSKFSTDNLKIVEPYLPIHIFDKDSYIDGSVSLKSNAEIQSTEQLEAFGNAHFEIRNLNILSKKSPLLLDAVLHAENNKIIVPRSSLTLFDYKVDIVGEQVIGEALPTFNAEISKSDAHVLSVSFKGPKNKKNLDVFTEDKNVLFNGILSYNTFSDILLTGEIKAYSYSYPIYFGLNLKESVLSLTSKELSIFGSYKVGEELRIKATSFETPRIPRLKLQGSVLTTDTVLRLEEGAFSLNVLNFNLEMPSLLTLGFRAAINNSKVNINALTIQTKNNTYKGEFDLNAKDGIWTKENVTMTAFLENESGDSYLYSSYISMKDKASLLLNVKDLTDVTGLLNLPFDTLSMMLLLESDLKDKHSAYGEFSLNENKSEQPNELKFNFAYDKDVLDINSLLLSLNQTLHLSNASATFNVKTGDVKLSSSLLYLLAQSDEPNPFSLDLNVSANIEPLILNKFNIKALTEPLKVAIKLSNISFDNTFYPPTVQGSLTLGGERVSFVSNLIKGSYDFSSSYFELDIDKTFTLWLSAKGTIKDGFLDVDVKNIYFPFKYLDILVWSDAIGFRDGIFQGEARFYGPLQSPEIFGFLEAPKATLWNLWAEKENCIIINPRLNFYGTTMNIPQTEVYAQNTETGRISHLYASAEFTIRSWFMPYLKVTLDIDKDNPVSISVPLPIPNLEIEVDEVWGHAEIGLIDLASPELKFDLTARNGSLSGPARYPKWMYDPSYVSESPAGEDKTSLYGLLKVERGAKFMFPTKNSPIINATLSENQSAELIFEDGKFFVNGDLAIKTGDIYYFQKNFLITDGTVSWHRMDLADELFGSSDFGGISVSLTSRLRDFDLNGEPTDIYLTLENATLDNIAPRLSSSTGLSDAEILSILGQNILPTSAYTNSGISSLVYVSSVAIDVASRMIDIPGVGKNTFDDTVLRSLGLDMFSIRQRIFYNMLVDVIPEKGRTNPDSAFARYLNGTSLFLGKHITENLFFQTTLNLFSSENYTGSKKLGDFFIQGLKGELEFALEWNNELASISIFSSPNELSFFEILGNIGISVRKHFVL